MKSYFIAGTDTNVGKTVIAAGLARNFSNKNISVGIMKPFAASDPNKSNFEFDDTEFLAEAARINESKTLLNPQFFPIPASPYTASQNLGVAVDVDLVLDSFRKLSKKYDVMLVEGMGGVMTPILQNYFVTNLIKDMGLETIIVTRTRIGTVNHTLLSCMMCKNHGITVRGIIINNFDTDGYVVDELKRDLENILNVPVLGIVPHLDDLNVESISNTLEKNLDLSSL